MVAFIQAGPSTCLSLVHFGHRSPFWWLFGIHYLRGGFWVWSSVLVFKLYAMKCHSAHTLMAPEVLHIMVNVLEINLGIASWSNEGWVGFVKPCMKFRIASPGLLEVSCNLPITVCCVTMLHGWFHGSPDVKFTVA